MTDWADKAAEKWLFSEEYPHTQEEEQYAVALAWIIRACYDEAHPIIQSAPQGLVEAVNMTLDVLNSWGSAKDEKRVPTPAEWAAYQGMVKRNYIDLAVRLRSALSSVQPKEPNRERGKG